MSSILCARCGHTVANNIELPTTPVPDLLGGDYIALESQVQMVRDTISVAQADISRLDGEITRLNAVLDGLTRKRDALQTYTHLHTALVAPIRRLPPEVLSEIFLHYNDKNNVSHPQLNKAPLLLGGVCSRWRTIALSTPRLWTSFALTIRPKYLKSDAMLAKTWLARAGTCPLTIRLASRGNYQSPMKPLMKVFLLHCEQWYDIHLSLPLPVLASLAPAKNRLPRLQRLCLNDEWDETFDTFEFAPRLRQFQLDRFKPLMVKVPWNQIDYFDMGRCRVDHSLKLLRATPNLEKCVVTLDPLYTRQPRPPVPLLRLRSMIINGDPTYFFDTLLLPNLHEISIDHWITVWTATATSQLTSLLSQCSLAKLSLNLNDSVSDDEMIQILRTCPSLVQLDIRGRTAQCMTTSFFAHFACRQGTENSNIPQLVPMLHTITVDYAPSYFDILDFTNAIDSRIVSNGEGQASDDIARLRTVKIRCVRVRDAVDSAILSQLRQLRRTGLEISFLQNGKDLL